MAMPDDYKEILDMLLEAAREGRVKWLQRGDTFAIRFPEFDFEIWRGFDDERMENFVAVALKDTRGREALDAWVVNDTELEYKVLGDLYDMARRQLNRIPEKLDRMKTYLKSHGPIGLESSV